MVTHTYINVLLTLLIFCLLDVFNILEGNMRGEEKMNRVLLPVLKH